MDNSNIFFSQKTRPDSKESFIEKRFAKITPKISAKLMCPTWGTKEENSKANKLIKQQKNKPGK